MANLYPYYTPYRFKAASEDPEQNQITEYQQPEQPSPASQVGQIGGQALGILGVNRGINALTGGGTEASVVAPEASPSMALDTSLAYDGQPLYPEGLPPDGFLNSAVLPAAYAIAASVGNQYARRTADSYNVGDQYDQLQAMSPINQMQAIQGDLPNLMGGERIGTGTQAALAIPTAGASFLYNPLFARNGMFGSGKDEDQVGRDATRSVWQDRGVLNQDYQLTLADGTTFDVGRDGGAQLPNGLHPYQIDLSAVQSGEGMQQLGSVLPLAGYLTGFSGQKPGDDAAGYIFNALQSSPQNFQSNLLALYQSQGGYGVIRGGIEMAAEQGLITQERANSLYAGLDRTYGVNDPNGPKAPLTPPRPSGEGIIKPKE